MTLQEQNLIKDSPNSIINLNAGQARIHASSDKNGDGVAPDLAFDKEAVLGSAAAGDANENENGAGAGAGAGVFESQTQILATESSNSVQKIPLHPNEEQNYDMPGETYFKNLEDNNEGYTGDVAKLSNSDANANDNANARLSSGHH